MASGGHHGGSFHTGGHHSGGGSYGGGSFGGGSSGGGGGFYGGGSSGVDYSLGYVLLIGTYMFIVGFYESGILQALGNIFSLDLIKLSVLIVGFILLIKGRSIGVDLAELTMNPITRQIHLNASVLTNGFVKYARIGDENTWVGKYYTIFRISFREKKYGESNQQAVFDMVQRTPRIVWIDQRVWIIGYVAELIINPLFYHLVIPVFENMLMDDVAFRVIDEVVYYLPAAIWLACGIICFATAKSKRELMYQCVSRQAKYIVNQEELAQKQERINERLKNKKYHSICPNCGAANTESLYFCSDCGSCLEIEPSEIKTSDIDTSDNNRKDTEETKKNRKTNQRSKLNGQRSTIICAKCGMHNTGALKNCTSCGSVLEDISSDKSVYF